MNKKNLKKWMLLKKESETGISLYRVLELAEEILVIDCVNIFHLWMLLIKFHPDNNKEDTTAQMQEINAEYDKLFERLMAV